LLDYDESGNILYGYFGAALEFPIEILISAGGAKQIIDKNSKLKWINTRNFGDDPKDSAAVLKGYHIYFEK